MIKKVAEKFKRVFKSKDSQHLALAFGIIALALSTGLVGSGLVAVATTPSSETLPETTKAYAMEETPEATPMPTPTPTPSPTPSPTPTPAPVQVQVKDNVMNILLLGMDARNYEDASRSDSIILVSYNRTKHKVKMTSFMRDSYVEIPGYGWTRINAATAYGGPSLAIDTVAENFNIECGNYVQVKFDDFKKIIDIIGGVDIELSYAEIDYINNKLISEDGDWENQISSSEGIVHLNGAQALWHCRNRSVGSSDYERTERQRDVLEATMNQIFDNFDLGMAIKLVPTLFACVDTDISIIDLTSMAMDFFGKGMPEVETMRVPIDGLSWSANVNGASVIQLDMEGTAEALDKFIWDNWTHEEAYSEEINPSDIVEYNTSSSVTAGGFGKDTPPIYDSSSVEPSSTPNSKDEQLSEDEYLKEILGMNSETGD